MNKCVDSVRQQFFKKQSNFQKHKRLDLIEGGGHCYFKLLSFDLCIFANRSDLNDYKFRHNLMELNSGLTAVELMKHHRELMPFVWTILSDISVCMAYYKYRRDTLLLHIGGALLTCFITASTSLPTLIQTGIPKEGDPLRMHYILGIFLYFVILLQIILGITTKLLRSFDYTNPQLLLKIRRGHKYGGYSILIIAKLVSFQHSLNWFNIFWNIGLLLFLVFRSYKSVLLQSVPIAIMKIHDIKTIDNYSQISSNYPLSIMYGNYIYNGESMKNLHPAGSRLVVAARGRCVERYLFGMHGVQLQNKLLIHSHSQNSLRLLGNPLARLQISEQFVNFTGEEHNASIHSISLISSANRIYHVNLKIEQSQNMRFSGCTDLKQLGRYYSLTINKSITRLYTTVNFLTQTNLAYLQNIFPDLQFKTIMSNSSYMQAQTNSFQQIQVEPQDSNEVTIPILVKLYEKGRFTNQLINEKNIESLVLSCSNGRGLQLDEIESGKVIIIAGGSGIFPFCDLIDLLFKQEQLKIENIHNSSILINNPALRNRPLDQWHFSFLLAFDSLGEMHPIIWRQLVYLVTAQKIQVIIRTKDNNSIPEGIIRIQESFQQFLDGFLMSQNYIRKILICGPLKMNRNVSQYLQNRGITNYELL